MKRAALLGVDFDDYEDALATDVDDAVSVLLDSYKQEFLARAAELDAQARDECLGWLRRSLALEFGDLRRLIRRAGESACWELHGTYNAGGYCRAVDIAMDAAKSAAARKALQSADGAKLRVSAERAWKAAIPSDREVRQACATAYESVCRDAVTVVRRTHELVLEDAAWRAAQAAVSAQRHVWSSADGDLGLALDEAGEAWRATESCEAQRDRAGVSFDGAAIWEEFVERLEDVVRCLKCADQAWACLRTREDSLARESGRLARLLEHDFQSLTKLDALDSAAVGLIVRATIAELR